MEVLHASAPGARVRVMRAAYHSSAGPGAPASSYMMHSSRQVLSSGYTFLEPSPSPSKPLEISSTPLESSPDSDVGRENYKVTEPDDYEISQPSKWRGSIGKSSIRMPSEESSSADNASIIDLDSRTGNTFKRAYQTKQSDEKMRTHIINTRVSPLLDAPVALSTLKYTSLLNNSDEWNSRRKSYSFEDTSSHDQNALPQNNSYTMDSSTDSGICKSSEVVDDTSNYPIAMKNVISTEINRQDESFKQWLSRNRSVPYRDTSMNSPRNYRVTETPPTESKITLQSSGKVSITLPFKTQNSTQGDDRAFFMDDNDRKTKRVEFCKTELHFAVDTGTVNIIATDEKPPPSNDFRKRRSAFVPLNDKIDRSITLFGEKSELSETKPDQVFSNNESGEFDDNIAATKSILKNKIPKPKPYLLGENMVFGSSSPDTDNLDLNTSETRKSTVSLINSQLQSDSRYSNENTSSGFTYLDSNSVTTSTYRTGSTGPRERFSNHVKTSKERPTEIIDTKALNKKASVLPDVSKAKVRELRGNDLAYFGIEGNENPKFIYQNQDNLQEEIFHSVKLVQQVTNSACNSEAESDDAPEYQNILTKLNKVPTPSPRTKFDTKTKNWSAERILKQITEHDVDHTVLPELRNNILTKHKEPLKQIIQTPKDSMKTIKEKQCRHKDISPGKTENNLPKSSKENQTSTLTRNTSRETGSPLYVNINIRKLEKKVPISEDTSTKVSRLRGSVSKDQKANKQQTTRLKSASPVKKEINPSNLEVEIVRYVNKDKYEEKRESRQPLPNKHTPRRTEKLITPDIIIPEKLDNRASKDSNKISTRSNNSTHNKLQRNESLKRNKAPNVTDLILENENILNNKTDKDSNEKNTVKSKTKTLNSNSTVTSNKQISPKPSKNIPIMSRKVGKIPDNTIDKSIKSKHSKYVINYDDKNGTVSSICKIKKTSGAFKRKVTTVENNIPEESKTKEKSLNKIALLQLRERYWNNFNQDSTHKKRKSHAQRSCQLL